MEAERVKTKKVSAADRIPEKTGRKKWSVLFLESLLKEAKEREAESEKARPAVDGESWIRPGRDTFEHSEDPEELWCESYEDIMGIVRMVGKWKANILYQIPMPSCGTITKKSWTRTVWENCLACAARSVRTREAAQAGRRSRKSRRLSLNFSCVPMRG